MDKYEYKLRSEQIQDLIAGKQYAKAMQVADTIDWRRVKNVSMLTTVSDLYKINRKYDIARDILLMAYDRYPGGRSIVYSLCELSIKLGEFVQAVEYYKEFVAVAPTDSGRYILKYKIFEAQEVSIEERIALLEQLKAEDYREKWGYELAYLYHRAGMEQKCISECDELILTFGEGKYVLKAMELKKLHTPLNPLQQDKYDTWMGLKVKPATTAAAKASLARPDLMSASTKVMPSREIDIQVKTMDVENKYNTMNIQAALADSMKDLMAEEQAKSAQPEVAPSASVTKVNTPVVQQAPVKENVAPVQAADDVTAFIPSGNMSEITFGGATQKEEVTPVSQNVMEQPTQVMPAQAVAAHMQQVEAQVAQQNTPQAPVPELSFDPNMDTAQLIQTMTMKASAAAKSPYESMVSMEGDGQISLIVPEEAAVEKQITGQMNFGDIMDEWEKKKTDSEQRAMDDIKQRMVRQTGRIFTNFDKKSQSGMLEGLDDIHNPLANLPITPAEPVLPPKSRAELFAESLLDDEEVSEEFPEVEELSEIIEPGDDTEEQDALLLNMEVARGVEEPIREDDFATEEAEVATDAPAMEETLEAEPEEDLVAEEPMSEEAAAAEADEDAYRVSGDFSTAEIADVAEKLVEQTQKEVSGEADVPPVPTSRALTEDERELFGALIQTDQMKDQIAEAIDAISLASYTGNVIITGEAGSGTLTLAKNLIKSVQMADGNFSGKAAKISGASLDKQDVEKTLAKLKNGALIIEKANGMSAGAVEKLCKYLDADHEEGIIVILEDTKMEMRKLIHKYKKLEDCFNARIDINEMDSDSLVAYAKDYAYEQEYSIDEMGVLAIYTRISDLQTGDHSVTLSEVREIMDEGIWSANRKTIKHFFDILSGKRYDDEDMIILREKDFIC